ncbi:MAG: phenylalanine--tRNA ligase subunit beta [Firmicutes bacterium]|nr:phenylalanine--tRNA ligase subunit beta [Bacillota bacterium]
MRVSYDWLQEYVDVDIEVPKLAELLTLSGSEVESTGPVGNNLDERIIVGQITELKLHSDGKLLTATIDIDGESLTVVTGAPNVAVGQKVALALVDSVLPGGQTIETISFGGVKSYGMLCSEQELALGDDASGILVLPTDTPVGIPLGEALALDDMIIDLEIYPNRPDCLSVIGIAREVAAITGNPLRFPDVTVKEAGPSIEELTSITVEDTTLCPFYSARVIRNIKVGPSPLWLQRRVAAGGMRPINNVVDITNFVLLEMGQPLHAFDYDRLAENRVVVRQARPGEGITTLDQETRVLDPETLVIADAQKPVCIAGIMGGANTEVNSETNDILLEAAIFEGVNIRRTSRRLGLRSEASARFERGLDPAGVTRALDRAAQLLAEIAGGEICEGTIIVTDLQLQEQVVTLRPSRCNKLLGADIPRDDMIRILRSLQFGVRDKGEQLEVTVPSHRLDIEVEADLIEEVARLYGYDRITSTLPQGIAQGGENYRLQITDLIRTVLVGAGLTEIMTYSFDSPVSYEKLRLPENHEFRQAVTIQNPLTEDWSILRTSLAPHLLEVLQHNAQRQHSDLQIFEIGSVYVPDRLPLDKQPEERLSLGIALMGEYPREWGYAPRTADFFDLKGLVEVVFDKLGLSCEWENGESPALHPGRCAAIKLGDTQVGIIGEVHPAVSGNWELPSKAYIAELSLESIIPHVSAHKRVDRLPRYPAVARDLALLVPDTIPAQRILEVMHAAGGDLVKQITLFDVYEGRQIPFGYRSLAYSILYQAADRTLTDGEVEAVEDGIITHLETELGITRR